MPNYHNITQAAKLIGRSKSRVSRVAAREGIGIRVPHAVILTGADVERLRNIFANAKSGNPNFSNGKQLGISKKK